MAKTERFSIKKKEENVITVEEERKYHSPLVLFFIKNGTLIFCTSLLFSITVFIMAMYFAISNINESSIVKYESNGVMVSFDGTDSSIINGTPITSDYATKVFDSIMQSNVLEVGVVIKLKEINLGDRTIVFYSDKTALIKYNNGEYLRVFSYNGNYGVSEKGILVKNAPVKKVSGNVEINSQFNISMLCLSDGSMEVTIGSDVFFVRNSDITNTDKSFYTNLSGVSVAIKKENTMIYYSDGTIRENDYIVVNGNKYGIIQKKEIYNNIKIIYYENGYAEIINGETSIMVKKGEHVIYDDSILEIVDNSISEIDIKNIMDIKDITLNNTNTQDVHYIIVLEETGDYDKYNIDKRLANEFIRFNVYVNGSKNYNNVLNNNLKESDNLEGISLNDNTYLLCEGTVDKLSSISVKIGMWIDYADITNEYMNSAFIGTVKVYVETLN